MTVYTNVTRTAGTLIEANTIADADDFRGFIHGFSRAKPLSNMIDIGTGIDGADRKLRGESK